MKLVNIVGVPDDLERCAETLAKSGVFQPDDANEFFPPDRSRNLVPISKGNEMNSLVDKMKTIISETKIDIEYVDPKEYSDADIDAIKQFIDYSENDILSQIEKKSSLELDISACKHNIETGSHFTNVSVDIERLFECTYVKAHFGKLSKESYEKLERYRDNPYIEFIPTSSDKHNYWGTYVTPIEKQDEVDRIFSALYFEEIDVSNIKGTPEEYIKDEKKRLEDLTRELDETEKRIKLWGKEHKEEFEKVYSRMCELYGYSRIINKTYKYRDSFILVGWIPSEYQGKISTQLSSIKSLDVTFTNAKDEIKHSPPVKLKNMFFSKPFEFYTEMYGLPNYIETDPSTFIAITYTILFGIMFADVGHGIILTLIAMFMYFKKKMPLGRLLIPCGISSAIFGLVFGSVFGFEELLNPLYKALFGLDEKPIEVLNSNTITTIIFAAIAIGVALVIIAMCINIYSSLKRGDLESGLFGSNGLAGLIFYASLAYGLTCELLLNQHRFTAPYILVMLVLPLLIIFFKEPLTKICRGEKNLFPDGVGSYIMDNFFELFETILSYMTNTMSFLRVGAFVLVHAGMMLVVFAIAEMFSLPGYIITLVIGNIIVIVLEALLVGIQVLRLEYYEMFSKFYTGDGRKFEPVNSKEINI